MKKFNASSVVIVIAALCSLAAGVLFQSVDGVFGQMKYNYYNPVIAYGLMGTIVAAVVLMLCVASLVSSSYNPFIYFRF